jgi:hypothetical protein
VGRSSAAGRREAKRVWNGALDAGQVHLDRAGLCFDCGKLDGFALMQDLTETDVLLSSDYANTVTRAGLRRRWRIWRT